MRNKLLPAIFCVVGFVASPLWASDSVTGGPQTRPVVVQHVTVHAVSGPVVEDGSVVFAGGKILAVGRGVTVPEGAEVVEGAGKHLYPGLIDSCDNVGLVEIDAVRATDDTRETGSVNPNVRAEKAVNPDSEIIPTTRANGVLVCIVAPEGGLVSGLSAGLRLDGWTAEQMTVKAGTGLHINWPQLSRRSTGRRTGTGQGGEAPNPEEVLRPLREFFANARAYQTAKRGNPGTPNDTKWEAVLPVLEGKVPIVVNADAADQIASAVAFAKREKLRLIINGGYDAGDVAALLKEEKVPVVIAGVQRSPHRRGDPYDAPFTLAARLRDAGVKFAIAADRGAAYVRNLNAHAATAAAYGLTREEAVRAVTLSPAEIFGIADGVGSVDAGKEATLILTDGDILEAGTHVAAAWVQGRGVDLSSRQTRLWKKYEEKYRQLAPPLSPPPSSSTTQGK